MESNNERADRLHDAPGKKGVGNTMNDIQRPLCSLCGGKQQSKGGDWFCPNCNKYKKKIINPRAKYKTHTKRIHPENSNLFKCGRCGEYKPREQFYTEKRELNGIMFTCKDCTREIGRIYRVKHKEDHKEEIEQKKQARKEEREKQKIATRERTRIKARERYRNDPSILRRMVERQNDRYKNDPKFRLNIRIRNSIGKHLRGEKCGRHWEDLVGWTINDLQKHITKQLRAGMTWDNYGEYWHIDHKVPVSAHNFKTEKDIDFKKCWSLKNLQPLEAKENLSKNNKLERAFQPSMAFY
jgi:hypothetical protein